MPKVVALDPGTATLVCAWEDSDGDVKVSSLRNVFFEVPNDAFSKRMLGTMNVPEFELDGKLYIAGDEAFELAKTFGKEVRRPMQSGVISSGEADAIPMMDRMIGRLLSDAGAEAGDKCCYSMPADPVDANFDGTFHKSVIEGILQKRQIESVPVTEGHAVVLAELADEQFTGIGISWGGGMVNVCVAFKSVPVITFSSARAGDYIDEKAAQVCGEVKPRMTAIKEDPAFSLTGEKLSREQAAIRSYYEAAIQYSLENIKRRFEAGKDMPNFSEPVTIVSAGGTSAPNGFVKVFTDVFERLQFPIPVKDIRVADDPLYTVTRGALVAGSI